MTVQRVIVCTRPGDRRLLINTLKRGVYILLMLRVWGKDGDDDELHEANDGKDSESVVSKIILNGWKGEVHREIKTVAQY